MRSESVAEEVLSKSAQTVKVRGLAVTGNLSSCSGYCGTGTTVDHTDLLAV